MSEWQLDGKGQLYKDLGGGMRQIAPNFTTGTGIIPESSVIKMKEIPEKPKRECPILGTNCREDKCAFYSSDKCILSLSGKEPTADTLGAFCPLARQSCQQTCALHNDNGCGILNILRNEE